MNLNNIYCIRAERKLLCTLYEVKWNDFQVQNIKILASWLSSLLPLPLVMQRVIGFFFFSFVNFAKIGSRLSKCTNRVESNRVILHHLIPREPIARASSPFILILNLCALCLCCWCWCCCCTWTIGYSLGASFLHGIRLCSCFFLCSFSSVAFYSILFNVC